MIIPLGLDSARLSRFPVIAASIAVACILVFLGTIFSGDWAEVRRARVEAVQYLVQHPYLEVPEVMVQRLGIEPGDLEQTAPPGGMTDGELAAQQAQLDALAEIFAATQDSTLLYRLSLVPARGALQPGWITYQFVHGGFGHIFGNLFIFLLLTGPFLEDVWGRPFFLGFYLLGGVVAAAFEVPGMPAHIPLLGASGSISACLGAFALRFGHRKVRMLWFWFPLIFLRKQFSVPAWLYALFGFAMDLLGLKLSGGSGTAYGAHVGGFLFGACVALGVRWTGLERRLAPEGAVQWREGKELNRAAEALAGGDVAGARAQIQEALRRRPGSAEASLDLARLLASQYDVAGATEALEPVVARRLAEHDAAGVRELMAEFQGRLRADRFRPATAYRLAVTIERGDPDFALALLEAVGASGGGLGAKALLRAAERLAAAQPERARELLGRAEAMAEDGEARARIEAQRAALPPPPDRGLVLEGPAGGGRPPPGVPLREAWCRVSRIDGGTLDLVMTDGKPARLTPDRVSLVSAALLERLATGGTERANGVVLDLLLRPRASGPLLLLRIPGHEMGLARHRPGVSSAVAFAELVEAILLQGGADAWPDPARVQGRPFARFKDLAAYEEACFGRRVSGGGGAARV